jgi:hypothetical protein
LRAPPQSRLGAVFSNWWRRMRDATNNLDLGFDPREFNADPVEKAYRDALADGLERVLERGAETLADILKTLNEMGVTTMSGTPWTDETLAAELDRLGR